MRSADALIFAAPNENESGVWYSWVKGISPQSLRTVDDEDSISSQFGKYDISRRAVQYLIAMVVYSAFRIPNKSAFTSDALLALAPGFFDEHVERLLEGALTIEGIIEFDRYAGTDEDVRLARQISEICSIWMSCFTEHPRYGVSRAGKGYSFDTECDLNPGRVVESFEIEEVARDIGVYPALKAWAEGVPIEDVTA